MTTLTKVTDVNETYGGNNFAVYTYAKALCYIPLSHTVLYVSGISLKPEGKINKEENHSEAQGGEWRW